MVNSRLDVGEDTISEIEERIVEKSQTEAQREREIWKKERKKEKERKKRKERKEESEPRENITCET